MIPVSIDLLNQVLGYLGTRPYQEVFQLVQAIQAAAQPKEAPNVDQVDTESN